MVDSEEVSGAAEAEEAAEEAAEAQPEEEEIVEEVEVIPEEVNCNRYLERLMDLDSSTSVIEPGLNTIHPLPILHTYSKSSLEKSDKCYKTIVQMELLHQVVATEEDGATVAVVVDNLTINGRSSNWSRKYGSLDLKQLNKCLNMWILILEEAIQMQDLQSAK